MKSIKKAIKSPQIFSLAVFVCISTAYNFCFCQGVWTQKANFGGTARFGAVGFSIGTKGYVGTGRDGPFSLTQDFWEWDQPTNTWTQKANFGGTARCDAVGFSIGTKGYIGTGKDAVNKQDFWEWDQTTNTWTQKANFGGTARTYAVGFAIGTKGYIGTGTDGAATQDFWEWDQGTNTWIQKANFPGPARLIATAFSIGNKGYIGTGRNQTGYYQDLWEWDQATNVWTQKANFPGTTRVEATAFRIGKYGYAGTGTTLVGTGTVADCWKYNPSANSWTSIPNFGGGIRELAASFSIGCYGYVATGFINDDWTTLKNDLWEYYDPSDTTCGCSINASISGVASICSGQTTIIAASGGNNYLWNTGSITSAISVSPTSTSTYSVIVSSSSSCKDTVFVTVTVSPKPVAFVSGTTICAGDTVILTASGGGNYLWSNGVTTSSITASANATISYSVIVSAGVCADTANAVIVVNPKPSVVAFNSITISAGMSITLGASGGSSYLWENGSTDALITVTPSVTTVYCVTATDINGCRDSACVTVYIEDPCTGELMLTLPNAFSPNNDGQNDNFCLPAGQAGLQGSNHCIREFRITVFNRWGEKVYESEDPNFCWDGTYLGESMNTAVFVYYLHAILINNTEKTIQGNISLIK